MLDSPTQVLRICICRFDGHRETKHFLAILMTMEDARLIWIVDQLVVDQGVEHGGILLGNIPDTSQTNRITCYEEGEAAFLREFIDE